MSPSEELDERLRTCDGDVLNRFLMHVPVLTLIGCTYDDRKAERLLIDLDDFEEEADGC